MTSGFDILKEFVSYISMCIGYAIMHACVKVFQAFGVCRYCGWIQIVTMEFYSDANAENPDDIYYGVDVTPTMKQNGLPFFAYGYPAEIYDPPCNNYFTGPKLIWNADTFLVTMPSFLNNECISYLAGFQWGYKEYRDGMDKSIDIFPLKAIDRERWAKHIPMLSQDFPKWNFVK